MKTIKSLKDITILEVDDVVAFGALMYVVDKVFNHNSTRYYLHSTTRYNGIIFERLNLKKRDFIEKLGIDADCNCDFPEIKSLEALTAIVSALFKEYEKQNELPKTWEEFCEKYHIKEKEAFINLDSDIVSLKDCFPTRPFRLCEEDKNLCTSKQEAEAFLALMQLRQLRKTYVTDWEPNWTDEESKWNIVNTSNMIALYHSTDTSHPLSFPNLELAKKFLTNFKDLLEIAKPLL